jgi:hypothetical protein
MNRRTFFRRVAAGIAGGVAALFYEKQKEPEKKKPVNDEGWTYITFTLDAASISEPSATMIVWATYASDDEGKWHLLRDDFQGTGRLYIDGKPVDV